MQPSLALNRLVLLRCRVFSLCQIVFGQTIACAFWLVLVLYHGCVNILLVRIPLRLSGVKRGLILILVEIIRPFGLFLSKGLLIRHFAIRIPAGLPLRIALSGSRLTVESPHTFLQLLQEFIFFAEHHDDIFSVKNYI